MLQSRKLSWLPTEHTQDGPHERQYSALSPCSDPGLRYSPLRDDLSFGRIREGLRELGNIRFDVDNAPHYFGTGLTAQECQELIEFLEKELGMPAAEV